MYTPPCKELQKTSSPATNCSIEQWPSFLKDVEPQRLRSAGIAAHLWVVAVGTRPRKATRPTVPR